MNKIFLIVGLCLLVSCVFASAYVCIYPEEDNQGVMEFKSKVNSLAIEQDINNGITEEGLYLKLKYFGPCR